MARLPLALLGALVLALAPVASRGEESSAETDAVRITLPDGTRALRVERLVKAPVADVWRAWSTSEGFSKAVKHDATIELRLGGKFEVIWAPDSPKGEQGSEGCTVQAWVPERMLAFTWNAPPQFPNVRKDHALVVVEMSEVGEGLTRMTLTHSAFGDGPEWDGVYDYFTHAWPHVMDWVADSLGGALKDRRENQIGFCYLIVGLSRPDLIETMTDEEKATLGEHYLHLKGETEKGTVVFAGPCTDMQGPGIVIFYADSPDEARAFMESDPAVKAGIFKAELHPLALSLLRERDRIAP